MVSVYVLLCAAQVAIGQCSSANAIDVIRFPDARDELACVRESMATIASMAISARQDEYWKFVCVRPGSRQDAALAARALADDRRGRAQ